MFRHDLFGALQDDSAAGWRTHVQHAGWRVPVVVGVFWSWWMCPGRGGCVPVVVDVSGRGGCVLVVVDVFWSWWMCSGRGGCVRSW